jgi:hypothetical protein
MVFVIQYTNVGDNYYLPSLSAFIALCLLTPLTAKYLYKTFLSLSDVVGNLTESNNQEWFRQQENLIFGINWWSILVVSLLIISGILTNYLAWGIFHKAIVELSFSVQLFFLFGILGNLGWSYWGILLFAQRLTTLKFDLEPFETKKDEFEKLNSAFLGMFGSGVFLYLGAVIALWLALGSYILFIPIIRFWVFPLAFMVISFFIAIQFFLHRLMQKAKSIRINKISSIINFHYHEWEKKRLPDDASAISNLLSWKEKIEKESDYPFDFLTIASVVFTVLLPTIRTIVELF